MSRTRKTLFTINGTVVGHEGRHSFLPKSPRFLRDQLARIAAGTKLSVTFSEEVASRSEQQLAYHWVLVGYLAKATGYTKEEMHDAIMRLKFGTTEVRLGARRVLVRRSVSDVAKMPTADMGELINFDLELCKELDVVVPTAEELGYISNY